MMEKYFTAPDAWDGGEFGIVMFLGRVDSPYTREFLRALWTWPRIEGCWLDRTKEPDEASRLQPTNIDLDDSPRLGIALFGLVELPNGCRCPCSSYVMDDNDGLSVVFGMPIGSLKRYHSVGAYPFDDGSDLTWISELSEWLVEIGRGLYCKKPFRAALIGLVSMVYDNDEMVTVFNADVPPNGPDGYLRLEGTELKWYPPNVDDLPPSRWSFWRRSLRALRSKWTKRGHDFRK